MVLINTDELMTFSGYDSIRFTLTKKAYKYTFGSNSWSALPSLTRARFAHSCGYDRSSNSVVVAGGGTNSVEILDLGTMRWRAGTNFPLSFSHAPAIPNGDSFIVPGGAGDRNTIYKYEGGRWVLLTDRLRQGKSEVIAIPVGKTQFPAC